MVIKKMNEITDVSNKKDEDTRDAADVTEPVSDQEKTVEVRNFSVIPKTNFNNLTYVARIFLKRHN